MRIGLLMVLLLATGCSDNVPSEALSSSVGGHTEQKAVHGNFVEYAYHELPIPEGITALQHRCIVRKSYDSVNETQQVDLDRMATGVTPIPESKLNAILNKFRQHTPEIRRECGVNI
jgi:hypothetical protein